MRKEDVTLLYFTNNCRWSSALYNAAWVKKIERARNSTETKTSYYNELLGRVLVYTGISLFVVNLVVYLGFINVVVGDTIKNLILFGSCLLFDFFVVIVVYIIIKIIEKKSLK